MSRQTAGINQEHIKRQIREDSEKLHPWPNEVGIGPDIAALNIYQKAQLQRSHRKWTPLDLVELARACKLIVLVDIEFERYQIEGVVVQGGKNGTTMVENPRGRAISTLNGTINQMLRRLGVSAMSVSDKQGVASAAEAEREARENAVKIAPVEEGVVADDALLN